LLFLRGLQIYLPVLFFVSFIPGVPSLAEEVADEMIYEIISSRYPLANDYIVFTKNNISYFPLRYSAQLFDIKLNEKFAPHTLDANIPSADIKFVIDIDKSFYTLNGKREPIEGDDLLDASFVEHLSDDIYISEELFKKIFNIETSIDVSTMNIDVKADYTLPFIERIEREKMIEAFRRGEGRHTDAHDPNLPVVSNDFKLFTKPVVDIDSTFTYNMPHKNTTAGIGFRSIMDLAKFSTIAQGRLNQNYNGEYSHSNVRVRGERYSLNGEDFALGLKAIQLGDVQASSYNILRNGGSGRGIRVSTKSELQDTDFDRITLDGLARADWDIEVYRNDDLIELTRVNSAGEYNIPDIYLEPGTNIFKLVFIGPNGEREEKIESYQIRRQLNKTGEISYLAQVYDRDHHLFENTNSRSKGTVADFNAAYGLNATTTITGNATYIQNERLGTDQNILSLGVLHSLPKAYIQINAHKDLKSGWAADTRIAANYKGLQINTQYTYWDDFEEGNGRDQRYEDRANIRLNRNFATFMGNVGLSVEYERLKYLGGVVEDRISSRQTMRILSTRISNSINYKRKDGEHILTEGDLSATRTIAGISFRGALRYETFPESNLKNATFGANYNRFEDISLGLSGDYNFINESKSATASIGYDFKKFMTTLDTTWRDNGSYDFMLRLNASLAPYGPGGKYISSSESFMSKRPVQARIYFDENDNGVFDDKDEFLPDVLVRVGDRQSKELSNELGELVELNPGRQNFLNNVKVELETLPDPYYVPRTEGYNVVLRRGAVAHVDIPVVESGSIESYFNDVSGNPLNNFQVFVIDQDNVEISMQKSSNDGYVVFEYLKRGKYKLVLKDDSGLVLYHYDFVVDSDKWHRNVVHNVIAPISLINPDATPQPSLVPSKMIENYGSNDLRDDDLYDDGAIGDEYEFDYSGATSPS
jgi:hypothetical protein